MKLSNRPILKPARMRNPKASKPKTLTAQAQTEKAYKFCMELLGYRMDKKAILLSLKSNNNLNLSAARVIYNRASVNYRKLQAKVNQAK